MSESAKTAEVPRAPAPPRHYDLFVSEGTARIFLKLRDEGVSLSAEGISWRTGVEQRSRAWGEIAAVHLATNYVHKQGTVYACKIGFHGGPLLTVHSVSAWGHVDEERHPVYREFVETLHARLSRPEFSGVLFGSGATPGRAVGMKIALGIAGLFFVGLPLALLLMGIAPIFEGLAILGAGSAFVWPLWRMARTNEPRTYSPRDLPYELLP